jgi:hypothetical protein
MEVNGQFHAPGGKASGKHWKGDWVGSRTGLDDVEKKILDPYRDSKCAHLNIP